MCKVLNVLFIHPYHRSSFAVKQPKNIVFLAIFECLLQSCLCHQIKMLIPAMYFKSSFSYEPDLGYLKWVAIGVTMMAAKWRKLLIRTSACVLCQLVCVMRQANLCVSVCMSTVLTSLMSLICPLLPLSLVDETSFEAGIKVQIHSQDEPPFIDQLGFGVAPGFQTFVSCQEQRVCVKIETLQINSKTKQKWNIEMWVNLLNVC